MKIETKLAETSEERQLLYALRKRVFVEEQMVPEEDEFDEFESVSRHLISIIEEKIVGTCRWRTTEKGIKLERFAVDSNYRGQGIGKSLVRAALHDIENKHVPGTYLYLHAQIDAVPLYKHFAFEEVGDIFYECDIAHRKMQRVL